MHEEGTSHQSSYKLESLIRLLDCDTKATVIPSLRPQKASFYQYPSLVSCGLAILIIVMLIDLLQKNAEAHFYHVVE